MDGSSAEIAEAPTERQLLEMSREFLRRRIPEGWSVRGEPGRGDECDANLTLTDAVGNTGTFYVDVKFDVRGRAIDEVADRLRGKNGLLISRYLVPAARERAALRGLSYMDATGNARIVLPRPGVWLETTGASDDPWRRRGRPTTTLRGAPATKIVRALLDSRGPWVARQLADQAEVSTGSVYRTLDYLDAEALVERRRGRITVPNWVALLRAWAEEYQFTRSNSVSYWLAPRGLTALAERVAQVGTSDGDYAITGSLAVPVAARYAPARNAMIYVRDPGRASKAWDLRAAEPGSNNILLAEPRTEAAFARTRRDDEGLVHAAPAQVACDLLNGPGRASEEAEEFIRWMENNEPVWRF